jgi:hypothetical protein
LAAEIICEEALGRASGPWPQLWVLWAILGSWWGTGGHERRRAEEDMRRAAQEWLDISDVETEWRAYFNRWSQELLGWRDGAANWMVS